MTSRSLQERCTPTVTGPLGIELGKLRQQVAGSFVVQPPWLKGTAVVASKVVVVALVIVLVLIVPTIVLVIFVFVLGLLVVVLLHVVFLVVIVAVFIVILVVVVVLVVVEQSKGSPNSIVVFVIIGLPTSIQPVVTCGRNMLNE